MRQSGRLEPGDGISSDKIHWEIIPHPEAPVKADDEPVIPASFLRRPGEPEFREEPLAYEQEANSGEDQFAEETTASPKTRRFDWEKWIALFWAVWRGPWVSDKLLSYLRPLQWIALIYSLLVLFLGWGFSVPSVLIVGRVWLTVFVFSVASWLLVWLNSWLSISCSCWFGGNVYTDNAEASVVKWTELLRSSTFVGTAVILHRLPVRNTLGLSLFAGILFSLLIWNIICLCKSLLWYRRLRGEMRKGLVWFLCVFNLYQLSWVFFTLYYFGGYR